MLLKITDNVYYTKHRYSYLEASIGYVLGENYAVMIDCGNSKSQVERFFNDLKKKNLLLPTYAVLTHHHWDHSFGGAYLDIPIISSSKAKEHLIQMSEYKWDKDSIDIRVYEGIDTEYSANILKKIYPNEDMVKIKIPDIIKSNIFTLNLGGIILYIYPNDNSHSDDALLVYLKQERIIFLGDSHCKSYKTKPMSFDRNKLRSYIDFISKLDFDIAIPGHGNLISKSELISNLEYEYDLLNKKEV